MDRSAVILSMDRERLRKVSDPYPLNFFSRRQATCCYVVPMWFIGFPWYSAATNPSTNAHTHKHTHTHSHTHTHQPHGSAEPCQKMASPLSLHPLYTAGSSLPCNHDLKVTDTLVLTSGPPDANDLDSAPQACNFWSLIRPDGSAPATLASLDARSCGHCILYALTGPRLYTAIPVFASNTGPVTNTFLSFFFGVFPMPCQRCFLKPFSSKPFSSLPAWQRSEQIQSETRSNMGWWWQTHVWGMDRVWIRYGTGYGTKSADFSSFSNFLLWIWLSSLVLCPSRSGEPQNSINSADNGATCL